MKNDDTGKRGYAFALPRVIVGLIGRKPRRAEWSGAEAYGFGVLVFGIACVFCARNLLFVVRHSFWRGLILVALPFATWMAFLTLYYLNALVIALLRKLHLYSGKTNDRFQHVVIMLLTSLLALHFLRDPAGWLGSLGVFWFLLLGTNIFCIAFERLLDEP
jgi:hypothetical protein